MDVFLWVMSGLGIVVTLFIIFFALLLWMSRAVAKKSRSRQQAEKEQQEYPTGDFFKGWHE